MAPPEPKIGSEEPEPSGKKKAAGANTAVASNEPAGAPFAGLATGKSKSPVHITSDSMSLDYTGRSVLFTGHVKATQDTGQLTGNTLRVNYADSQMKTIKDMVANGNVRISQGTRWATSDHAVMNQAQQTVVLTGSPVVHDGTDQITGRRITVYLKTNRSVVEGARAVIFPNRNQNQAAAAPNPSVKNGGGR